MDPWAGAFTWRQKQLMPCGYTLHMATEAAYALRLHASHATRFRRCFRRFVLPVLEYCSAVWCSAADTHRKLLDRVVSGTSFLTGSVFECDLAHRRSAVVLCTLYKIRCNPMHHLYGAIPVPYVPVLVTFGAVISQRYTYAPPSCRTAQFRRTFIPLSVSLWNDPGDLVFDGVGLAGFKSRANVFLLA